MIQRVVRQIREAGLDAPLTIATNEMQSDTIQNQFGNTVSRVVEPERCDTFPAIALASIYLETVKGCECDETIVIIPSDPYTETGYFNTIGQMDKIVETGQAELVLMGISPTCASTQYVWLYHT